MIGAKKHRFSTLGFSDDLERLSDQDNQVEAPEYKQIQESENVPEHETFESHENERHENRATATRFTNGTGASITIKSVASMRIIFDLFSFHQLYSLNVSLKTFCEKNLSVKYQDLSTLE